VGRRTVREAQFQKERAGDRQGDRLGDLVAILPPPARDAANRSMSRARSSSRYVLIEKPKYWVDILQLMASSTIAVHAGMTRRSVLPDGGVRTT
jgi:hypothetical protein